MKTCLKFAIAILLLSIFLSACSSEKKLAEKTVENYHQLYNEQNYEEIFNTAHEDAKATKSKEALGYVLAIAFEKFGKHISSKLVYTKITILNDKERQIEFAYQSKFEKGTRNETFLIITNEEMGLLHSIGELTDDQLKALK